MGNIGDKITTHTLQVQQTRDVARMIFAIFALSCREKTVQEAFTKPFDAASIGGAVATRAIMEDLRSGMDGMGGGPPPFSKADRSRFLQELDKVLVKLAR